MHTLRCMSLFLRLLAVRQVAIYSRNGTLATRLEPVFQHQSSKTLFCGRWYPTHPPDTVSQRSSEELDSSLLGLAVLRTQSSTRPERKFLKLVGVTTNLCLVSCAWHLSWEDEPRIDGCTLYLPFTCALCVLLCTARFVALLFHNHLSS